jgi:large-conductance mechanosensitive channel
MNRKEFLNTVVRCGLLALIVFMGVFLVTNRKTKVEEECDKNFECRNCNKRDDCKIDKSKKGR